VTSKSENPHRGVAATVEEPLPEPDPLPEPEP
jgi:hypothetical protein